MNYVKRLKEAKARQGSDSDASKRRHDMVGAIRDLKLLHQLLLEGYRFEDENAQAYLDRMGACISIVEDNLTQK